MTDQANQADQSPYYSGTSAILIPPYPREQPQPFPGVYRGTWGGYEVRFQDQSGHCYLLQTSQGVRGLKQPCTVTVRPAIVGQAYYVEHAPE